MLDALGRKRDRAPKRRVVLGHAHVVDVDRRHSGALGGGMDERARNLSGAIGSKIDEHHRVAVLNTTGRLATFIHDDRRFYELVALLLPVTPRDRFGRARDRRTGAADICRVGALGALPAVVAVHAVVATDHGPDASRAHAL